MAEFYVLILLRYADCIYSFQWSQRVSTPIGRILIELGNNKKSRQLGRQGSQKLNISDSQRTPLYQSARQQQAFHHVISLTYSRGLRSIILHAHCAMVSVDYPDDIVTFPLWKNKIQPIAPHTT